MGNKIQPIPKQPVKDGFIPSYDGGTVISIGPAGEGKSITWIKPDGLNLLIADRVLLVKVSWEDLNKNGFVRGKPILINGQYFRCRLLQVGENSDIPNEWDKALDETSEDDDLWHWVNMYSWGTDVLARETSLCVTRGYYTARRRCEQFTTYRSTGTGFRPVLEPIPSDSPTPNINLDGTDFRLSSIPGGDGYCPILQPVNRKSFEDISDGQQLKMYTLMEGGHPIHFEAAIKDVSKLTLTDRYFGDEYLVPWVISNGVAVAAKSILKQDKG